MFCFEEEKIIPFTNFRYRLNKFGEVLDYNGDVLKVEDVNGVAMVEFNWVYGQRKYEVGMVVCVTAFNIKIPPEHFDKIQVFYSDKKLNNFFPSNLSYRFVTPIEIQEAPGFFYIPYYTGYGISLTGDIYGIKRKGLGNWRTTKPYIKKNITGGYKVSSALKDIGQTCTISRHRALGLVFLEYKTDSNKLVINHKNGVPGYDSLENLEWVTKKENNIHAINSGLTPNSLVGVLVKNLLTGKIDKYASMAECARALGRSHCFVRIRTYKTKHRRYLDNMVFKVDDGSPWPELDKLVYSPLGTEAIVAKNVFTGECFIFRSSNDAGDKLGVWYGAVLRIAREEENRPINGYIFRFLADDIKWPEYTQRELEIFKCNPLKKATSVLVKNPQGEEVAFYANIKTAAKKCGVSPAEIRRYCNGKISKNGNIFSFYKTKH